MVLRTGPLRRALGDEEEYEFYDGEYDIDPAPGMDLPHTIPLKELPIPQDGQNEAFPFVSF